jgi:hypothetical protein
MRRKSQAANRPYAARRGAKGETKTAVQTDCEKPTTTLHSCNHADGLSKTYLALVSSIDKMHTLTANR